MASLKRLCSSRSSVSSAAASSICSSSSCRGRPLHEESARLDVEQLRSNGEELSQRFGPGVCRFDLAPVLVGDFGQRERCDVELLAVDEVEKKVDRPGEAVDLYLHHLAQYIDEQLLLSMIWLND